MTVLSNAIAFFFAGLTGITAVSNMARHDRPSAETLDPPCPKPWLLYVLSFFSGIAGWLLIFEFLLDLKGLEPLGFLAGLTGAFVVARAAYALIWCPDPLRRK